jgi:hypothetical protein
VENGKSACLMLDHPTSGRLYACASSPMRDGECSEKVTKSGTTVKYCACSNKDFCAYERWPDRQSISSYEYEGKDENSATTFSVSLALMSVVVWIFSLWGVMLNLISFIPFWCSILAFLLLTFYRTL